jgi:virginiamycin B lyase
MRLRQLLPGLLLATVACSNAAGVALPGAAPPTSPIAHGKLTATVKIVVPKRKGRRRAHYVSPATQSLTITVTPAAGGASKVVGVGLTASNPNCQAGIGMTCTVTIPLAQGSYTAAIATYDGALDSGGNPTGTELSAAANIPLAVKANKANEFGVTLDGIPANVVVVPAAGSPITGDMNFGFKLSKCTTTAGVAVYASDADGNFIVGPGAPAVALTSANPAVLAIPAPSSSAPNVFQLTLAQIPSALSTIDLTATATPGGGVAPPVSFPLIRVSFDASVCGKLTEIQLPSAVAPEGIAAGGDGGIWFTSYAGSAIGRIDETTLALTQVPLAPNSIPRDITQGPDRAMWFAENGGIGRIDYAMNLTEPATGLGTPYGITVGPDGALWYTDQNGHIGKVTTAGVQSTVATLGPDDNPNRIVTGPDGALWFSECDFHVVRVTTSGAITEYPIEFGSRAITNGPDGALWFTDPGRNKFGRVTTAGSLSETVDSESQANPYDIITGPDGRIWMTETAASGLAFVDVLGNLHQFATNPPITADSQPQEMTVDGNGSIWFVEFATGKIARVQ